MWALCVFRFSTVKRKKKGKKQILSVTFITFLIFNFSGWCFFFSLRDLLLVPARLAWHGSVVAEC